MINSKRVSIYNAFYGLLNQKGAVVSTKNGFIEKTQNPVI